MIIKLNPREDQHGISFETTIRVNPHDLIVLASSQNRDECEVRTTAFEKDMHIDAFPNIGESGAFIKIASNPEEISGTQKKINEKISEFVTKVKEYGEFIGNLAKEFETRRNDEELHRDLIDFGGDDVEEKSFDNYDDFIDSIVDKIKKVSNSGVGGTFVIQIPKRYDKKCN